METTGKQSIRAFIAIEIPDAVKIRINTLQNAIKFSSPPHIKWVEASNIHITLKFFAGINETDVQRIIDALHRTCSNFSPFSLRTGNPGAFPNLRRPRVLWLGLNGDTATLSSLQNTIDSGLESHGFAREIRPFEPHLTLARVKDSIAAADQQLLGNIIIKTEWEPRDEWSVTKVTLLRSRLLPAGPVYSRLAEVMLGRT
jgi:2'-5' RNA ligase